MKKLAAFIFLSFAYVVTALAFSVIAFFYFIGNFSNTMSGMCE